MGLQRSEWRMLLQPGIGGVSGEDLVTEGGEVIVEGVEVEETEAVAGQRRKRKGGEGLDPRDQAWPSCKGWKDQEFGGNLPILSSHQGARDHRYVHRPCPEGRGAEDHARAEADQGWSEDQVQGFRCYWRLQWPCW